MIISLPNKPELNSNWEYDNFTGYIPETAEDIAKLTEIITNPNLNQKLKLNNVNLVYVENFSQSQDKLSTGRNTPEFEGGQTRKKNRKKHKSQKQRKFKK